MTKLVLPGIMLIKIPFCHIIIKKDLLDIDLVILG